MKKFLTGFFLFIIILTLSFVFAGESDSLIAKVNVLEEEISILVPEEVIFNNIAPGYLSEREPVEVKNIGTTDVSISISLSKSYSGDIFTNLAFRRILSDDLTKMEDFSFNIDKPSEIGGSRSENIYMYLDLTNYNGTTSESNHTAEVIFTAVPA